MAGYKKKKLVGQNKAGKSEKSTIRKRRSIVTEQEHSNESKQKKSAKKEVEKQKEDFAIKSGNSTPNSKKAKTTKIRVDFPEDEEIFTMDVEGIKSKFVEEGHFENDDNNSLSSESEEEMDVDGNNNASVEGKIKDGQLIIENELGQEICDSEADTVENVVAINVDDPSENFGEQETVLFAKWEKYMKQKGLVRQANESSTLGENKGEQGSRNYAEEGARPKSIQKKSDHKPQGKRTNCQRQINESLSKSTIYKPAVEKAESKDNKRNSSSSDEIETSDFKESDSSDDNLDAIISNFVGCQRLEFDEAERRKRLDWMTKQRDDRRDGLQQGSHNMQHTDRNRAVREVEDWAEQRIREAEQAKVRIFDVPGNSSYSCTASIDEDFMLLGAHIDDNLKKKIAEGEYVNFSKLVQKDRVIQEDDNRLEMISKGGMTYWVPLADRENALINGLDKWDQAFRVYSKIYAKFNPRRGEELVEYSYIIHSAAAVFSWNNVYTYDKLFRMHIAKHLE